MHDGKMTRDLLPGTQASVGGARHAIEPEKTIIDRAILEFARALAERLERGRVHHAYAELVLLATPHFLSVLRSTIGHKVSKLLVEPAHQSIIRSAGEQIRSVVHTQQ